MQLCDKYLNELIKINPTFNDYYLKDEFLDKKHIQPNIYSEEYYKELDKLDKEQNYGQGKRHEEGNQKEAVKIRERKKG